jgi:hypothetical protein
MLMSAARNAKLAYSKARGDIAAHACRKNLLLTLWSRSIASLSSPWPATAVPGVRDAGTEEDISAFLLPTESLRLEPEPGTPAHGDVCPELSARCCSLALNKTLSASCSLWDLAFSDFVISAWLLTRPSTEDSVFSSWYKATSIEVNKFSILSALIQPDSNQRRFSVFNQIKQSSHPCSHVGRASEITHVDMNLTIYQARTSSKLP